MNRLIKLLLITIALTLVSPILVTGQDYIFFDSFESAKLIHRWTFSETGGSGTTLVDDIGSAHGTIVEAGGSAAVVGNGEVKINGGARDNADYVEFPSGLLSGLNDASIELWATHESLQAWGRIFDVGANQSNALLMTWSEASNPESDVIVWNGPVTGVLSGAMAPYVIGFEYHIVMTIDRFGGADGSTRIKLYLDGVFQGFMDIENTLADLDDQVFWLARSQYADDVTASASYNELSIWDGVLSEAEVAANWETGPVDGKMPRISVSISGPDYLIFRQDVRLSVSVISTGASVSQLVQWTSSDPTIVFINASSGLIDARKEGQVTITATSNADPSASASRTVTARLPEVIHQWPFNESGGAGTVLVDIVGGANGVIVNQGSNNGNAATGMVTLTGGAQNSSDFIAVPTDVLLGLTDTTIELWATPHSVKAWSRIFDFGPDTSNYLMMSWTQGTDINTDRIEWVVNGSKVTADNKLAPYQLGRQYHIVLRIDVGGFTDGRTLVNRYLDGEWKGAFVTSKTLADIVAGYNWLGRSKYNGDETANASYNELRIYDGALGQNEIIASFNRGPVGGTAVISLGVTGPATVEVGQSIQLTGTVASTVGTVSQDINWSSSAPASATVNGAGLVTGVVASLVTITATSAAHPTVKDSFNVTVVPAVGEVQGIVYDPNSDKFFSFRKEQITTQTWGSPFPDKTFPVSAWSGWPAADWGPGDVDAVVYSPDNKKFYLFKGNQYARHSVLGVLDPGYPLPIVGHWAGWPSSWGAGDVDAVVYSPENKKFYLFKGDEYARHSWDKPVDGDYPKTIVGNWDGWPGGSWGTGDVGAVTYYPGNRKFYMFKGNEYARSSWAKPMDNNYPRTYNFWTHAPLRGANDLVNDFLALKSDYSIQHWSGMIFPSPQWEDNRGFGNHIQGATKVYHSRWVLSHSQEDHPGFLIVGNNDAWGFVKSDTWGEHPGSIQASGNTVAVPFTDTKEIRFFHIGPTKTLELTHLQIPGISGANAVGLAYYPPEQAYYVIVGTIASESASKKLPIYRSIPGKSLTDTSNKFESMGTTSNEVEAAESGTQLVYDEKSGSMYLLTLSRAEGSDVLPISTHRAVLTRLDIANLTGTELYTRTDFVQTLNVLEDPTFRFGAGAVLDSKGRLNLIATQRCISRILPWFPSCGVFDDVLTDYFILKP